MSQWGKFTTDTGLKPQVYCEIHKDLSGGDQFNQHFVNSFDKDLKVMDVEKSCNSGLTQVLLLPKPDHRQNTDPGFWYDSPGHFMPTIHSDSSGVYKSSLSFS